MLYVFGLWTVLVWGNRIGNILADDSGSAFDLAVAAALTALGVAVLAVALGRRRTGAGGPVVPVVGAAAVLTVVVWAVRVPLMLGRDHPVAFEVVHTLLAVGSVALAVAAWRTVRAGAGVPTGRVGATRP